MSTTSFARASIAGALLGLVLPAATASAQAVWMGDDQRASLRLEMAKPSVEEELTFASFVGFLSGRVPVADGIVLVSEIPFANAKYDVEGADGQFAIGNVLLAGEFAFGGSPAYVDLGVRLPTAPESSDKRLPLQLGLLADVERWEAFVREAVPVHLLFGYRNHAATGLLVRVRGGPIVWFPTGEADTELFGVLDADVGYANQRFGVVGGLSSRILTTESDLDFGERTVFEFGIESWFTLGRVRPGLLLRLPVDEDLGDMVNSVIGVSVEVEL
jgi:hypothetical protein